MYWNCIHKWKKKNYTKNIGSARTEYMISENLAKRIDFRRYNSLAAAPVPIAERVHGEDDVERLMDYLHHLSPYLVQPGYPVKGRHHHRNAQLPAQCNHFPEK
jgi:hypothetical protein